MIAFDDIWGTGAISFDEPSGRLSIVERFLVGLSLKRLQRVERLQKGHVQTRTLQFDTGQTPSQFLRAPHAFSDFFTHSVRNVQDSGLPNRSH